MRNVIIFLLIIVLSAYNVFAQSNPNIKVLPQPISEGYNDGYKFAENKSTTECFWGGFICGIFFNFLGTLVIYGVTQGDKLPPEFIGILGKAKNEDYAFGFEMGYTQRTKEIKRSSRVEGGLYGSAIFLVRFLFELNDE